ncbi:alternative ribosome rescue aminoacyl-tRNA hydrolase ArfB [Desulfovibrio ferrophilus]|uniref:Class I peptide chain release factor n=1 Tax=Desulfovibrio ferrophilus TaxID=241368 RepID=A0A2Z6B125_9BACT|nr:alternative ribosome rescue aminoacyl-tRNA hydrolase ArfB [Desulfovibrio ferrophilus]BBD09148.1 class I peptide chain release factor [Desulfovibrio ferrophilus]
MDIVYINAQLSIPMDEVQFTAVRSGGPGGQNVNKVATSVTLIFDVAGSPSLSGPQRVRIQDKLANRIGRDGALRLTARDTRSQLSNKELAVKRFAELLREALKRPKARRKTRPTLASKHRRLDSKKQRAGLKKTRGKVSSED